MRPILLVEDSDDDVFFLKRAMQKAGIEHPIDVMQDGKAAPTYFNKRLAENGELPILTLLDLQLPGMRGLEVLEWMRQQPALRSLIVIVHSSSHLNVDIEQAYIRGANSFLVKTSSSEKLAENMRLLKAYWLDLNAAAEPTRPPA